MTYYLQIPSPNKAKNDIDVLFAQMGYSNLGSVQGSRNAVLRFLARIAGVCRIVLKMRKGDVLCLQYPLKKFYVIACRMAHIKGAKVVTIIHDLGAFRRHKLTAEQENLRLSHSDYIILHNEKMKKHVQDHGCQIPLYCLEIFDYLTETKPSSKLRSLQMPRRVVFAGKLDMKRNSFLYKLEQETTNWEFDIYGNGYVESENKNSHMYYHGSVAPDDFVAKVDADFGLVWDGSSLDECDGEWGRYLLINNPHKTSFYLRAGIPVIVWAEAAMAPFVEEHGIGICVHSLRELKEIFAKMTDKEYEEMKRQAMAFSEKLGSGFYTRRAFGEALTALSSNH